LHALRYTLKRLQHCLSEIDALLQSDFPYDDSRAALESLKTYFENHVRRLGEIDADGDGELVVQSCAVVLDDLFQYVPLVGFVLRSTVLRNGFESWRPLLRLSRSVLRSAAGHRHGLVHLWAGY